MIPEKYKFLLLPDEKKTPEQRRWKWMKFECLPDDMKPLLKAGKTAKGSGPKQAPGAGDKPKVGAAVIAEDGTKPDTIVIINDRDLDYT